MPSPLACPPASAQTAAMCAPGGRGALTALVAFALVGSACSAAPPTTTPAEAASPSASDTTQTPIDTGTPTATSNETALPGPTESGALSGDAPVGGTASQPSPVDWSPTSVDLIAADVKAGRIDADTGLLYRIFASFGDDRLPAEYASTQLIDIDMGAVDDAAYRIETNDFPQAITDQIRPYLLRPTNPESAFYAPAPVAALNSVIVPAVL